MHQIEPFYNWEKYYVAAKDPLSPFYRRQYDNHYTADIYGYYIHPLWDYIGSETLYIKILFVDYKNKFCIIEMFGEWNDALHNDIMFFKRNVLDILSANHIKNFILIGENVLNFHGAEDCYYEEWFDDIEEGWISCINFRYFVHDEWKKYRLDYYLNFGGSLEVENWRTLQPIQLFQLLDSTITKRLK